MQDFTFLMWAASFLWAYALVLVVAWFATVGRERKETHIGHWAMLMGVMVPNIAASLLIVLAAALFELWWVLPLLTVSVPGGLVVSLQLEVSRLAGSSLRTELSRLGVAVALTLVFGTRA